MKDLFITRATTAEVEFTVSHLPAGGLADGSLSFKAWRDRADTAPYIDKSGYSTDVPAGDFTVVTNGSDVIPGVAHLLLEAADTANLPLWTVVLKYEATWTNTATQRPSRIQDGSLTVNLRTTAV